MIEKIFLVVLLSSLSYAYIVERVPIDDGSTTSLSTSTSDNTYFYMEKNRYQSYIYFYLKDDDFGLDYGNVRCCYTNTYPPSKIDFNKCEEIVTLTLYKTVTESDVCYYLYKFYSSSNYNYVVIYYSGRYSSGSLEVQASYSDINSILENIIGAALSVVAIVFIVIGSIIGLSIIITIIVCCCICTACCHKTTTVGSVGYIQPPPTVVISNPTTSPLMNQTPHYI